jgi:hypothetical protein
MYAVVIDGGGGEKGFSGTRCMHERMQEKGTIWLIKVPSSSSFCVTAVKSAFLTGDREKLMLSAFLTDD